MGDKTEDESLPAKYGDVKGKRGLRSLWISLSHCTNSGRASLRFLCNVRKIKTETKQNNKPIKIKTPIFKPLILFLVAKNILLLQGTSLSEHL